LAFGRSLIELDRAVLWLEEALAAVMPRVEEISWREAIGRVAARQLASTADWPAGPVAGRDGFALVAEHTVGASLYAPAALPLGAGASALAYEIGLGEPVPAPCDSVVGPDEVSVDAGLARITSPVAPGSGVIPPGAELGRRTEIAASGRRLTAADCILAAAAGLSSIAVAAPPRVILVRCGGHAGADLTGPLLATELRYVGARAHAAVPAPGKDALASLLDTRPDLILLYGGSGWSPSDDAAEALARMGQCDWHGCAISPGASVLAGMAGGLPVVGMPGAPWHALAAFRLLLAPALDGVSNGGEGPRAGMFRLQNKVTSTLGLTEYVPVATRDGVARPLRRGGLLPPPGVTGAIRVADGDEGFARGTDVTVELL